MAENFNISKTAKIPRIYELHIHYTVMC